MGLKSRLERLESGSRAARCPECGAVRDDPIEFTVSTTGARWQGYPEPLLCGGCGRVLKFTLKLGEAGPA